MTAPRWEYASLLYWYSQFNSGEADSSQWTWSTRYYARLTRSSTEEVLLDQTVKEGTDYDGPWFVTLLDRVGDEGWELVSHTVRASGVRVQQFFPTQVSVPLEQIYLFKRPIS